MGRIHMLGRNLVITVFEAEELADCEVACEQDCFVFLHQGNYFHGTIPTHAFNLMQNLSWFDVGRNPLIGKVTRLLGCF